MSPEHEFEFSPQLAMSMRNMDITGMVRNPQLLQPSLVQYEMQPGQQAVMVTTDCELEDDFTLLLLLDPSEYAARFPDWQARVNRHYRLCQWRSYEDPEGGVGWFQLGKIIPLKGQEQYDELVRLAVEPETRAQGEVPDWLSAIYGDYLEALSQVDPDQVFVPVVCGECSGKNVQLHVRRLSLGTGMVGQKVHDQPGGTTKVEYGMIRQPNVTTHMEAHLHCEDCGHKAQFDDEEIESISFNRMGL